MTSTTEVVVVAFLVALVAVLWLVDIVGLYRLVG